MLEQCSKERSQIPELTKPPALKEKKNLNSELLHVQQQEKKKKGIGEDLHINVLHLHSSLFTRSNQRRHCC